MKVLIVLVTQMLFAAEAHRPFEEMAGGCQNYKMALQGEFGSWRSRPTPILAASSPTAAARIPVGQKIDLSLLEQNKVELPVHPEKAFEISGMEHSGIVKILVPKTGTYRISLGRKMWADLVDSQSGKLIAASKFEMQTACRSIFKVVEFPLMADKEYWLQLSSSPEKLVQLLVTQAP